MSEILEFRPRPENPDAKPMVVREGYVPNKCLHDKGTFIVSDDHVTCSTCEEIVEAISVLRNLASREAWRARRDNADTYHRLAAEELAEKQAKKTRKAAYATLFRFGVTPEMYTEEYRRHSLLTDLALKQDASPAIPFGGVHTAE